MKLLQQKDVDKYQQEIDHTLQQTNYVQQWEVLHRKLSNIDAILYLPLGEIANPKISGFVWAWNMQHRLGEPEDITEKDRFNAQGLEGKIKINCCTLMDALTIVRYLDNGRYNIYC